MRQPDHESTRTPSAPRENAPDALTPPPPGQRVGDYTLIRLLGRGGMGEVWEAHQPRPSRRVAIKLVRTDLVSPAMRRRFDLEAEVLGRLSHENIAKVIEAGVDEQTGRPFYAMEYVEGQRLDEWVEQHQPSREQRLRLLIELCHAVQHAHQKGVVHRDLKPANILVTPAGRPRILDFGLARLTDAEQSRITRETKTGQVLGTLAYMSPEQAAGETGEIDALSDVYALGVIAFELLTGRLPIDVDGKTLPVAVRMIVQEEPERLSSIDRSLRGDLETIVAKAVAKERERRYHTAEALAEDVRRYLDYEPITARPPSTWYNLRKFARRNKALVGGVAASFLILLAGATTSTAFAVRATRQAELAEQRRLEATEAASKEEAARRKAEAETVKAERVVQFLGTMLLAASPRAAEGEDTRLIRRVVAETEARVDEELADVPDARALLLQLLGQWYRVMGDPAAARPLVERAVAVLEAMPPAEVDREQLLSARDDLAATLIEAGDAPTAVKLLEALHAEAVAEFGTEHLSTAQVGETLAVAQFFAGDIKSALSTMQTSADVRRRLDPEGARTLQALFQLAVARNENGDALGSEALYRELLPVLRRRADEGELFIRTLLADALENYAKLLLSLGRTEEARPLALEAAEVIGRSYEPDHPRRYFGDVLLARIEQLSGDFGSAEARLRHAVEGLTRTRSPAHRETLSAEMNLAEVLSDAAYADAARLTEARQLLDGVHARAVEAFGADNDMALDAEVRRLKLLLETEDFAAVGELGPSLWERCKAALGQTHPRTLSVGHTLGVALLRLERPAEAVAVLESVFTDRRETLGVESPLTGETRTELRRAMDARAATRPKS